MTREPDTAPDEGPEPVDPGIDAVAGDAAGEAVPAVGGGLDELLAGLGGGGGLGGLLAQAQELLSSAQAAADTVVEGVAGGGAVRIRVDGHLEFHAVRIDPGAVDPDDVGLLEDLVLAALRDATAKLRAGAPEPFGGGLDLGGLFGGET